MAIGRVSENGVTRLVPSPAGLYMRAHVLFRFRRPPVLIPWSEVRYESTGRVRWTRSHLLALGRGITTIRVKDEALRALQAFLDDPKVESALR